MKLFNFLKSNLIVIIAFLIGILLSAIITYDYDTNESSTDSIVFNTPLYRYYIHDNGEKIIGYSRNDEYDEDPIEYYPLNKEDMLHYIAENTTRESSIEAMFARLRYLVDEGYITFTNRAIWYNGPDNDNLTDIQIFLKGEDEYSIINLEKYPKTY